MITERPFGKLPDGRSVTCFTLTNAAGMSVEVLDYGGIIVSIRVPSRTGAIDDVALGFGTLEPYLSSRAYFGAIVGRIAGRVTGGRLHIGKHVHALSVNDGANHLHGGRVGFDRRLWTATPVTADDGSPSLRLEMESPPGDEGYPGSLSVRVTYRVSPENGLHMDSEAWSDAITPLSLTQHTYFNLAGEGSGSVLGHEVQILADDYVPSDGTNTLLDQRLSVANSGADLRRGRILSEAISGIERGHGDLYLLRAAGEPQPSKPTLAACVREGTSGRVLDVYTDDHCLQLYSGVGLDGSLTGKSGRPYSSNAGLCLECEGYPNASGLSGFGDILVHPESPQKRSTIYRFSRD